MKLPCLILALTISRAADLPNAVIDLEISAEHLARLEAAPREYVECRFNERRARLHLKGTGTFQRITEKPNFTIKFEHGEEWHGLEKLHLNNSMQDPSYLRELLGARFFESVNVPAPRVSHATVVLNRRKLGLYVLKEGYTDSFLKRHGLSGGLFEPKRAADVDSTMELKAGSGDFQFSNGNLDREEFIKFMALEVMISHWDGYTLGKNNYRVFQCHSGRFIILPGGMDQVFSNPHIPWLPDPTGMLARSLVKSEEYRRTFARLFAEHFQTYRLNGWIDAALRELRPIVNGPELAEVEHEAKTLRAKIAARHLYLQTALSEPDTKLSFEHGVAVPARWKLYGADDEAVARPPLRLVANQKAVASWRAAVRLPRGRYRFEGRVRTVGVQARGASLRVHGAPESSEFLAGSSPARWLSTPIVVEEEAEVLLVCDLRAVAGEAWFEELRIVEERSGTDRANLPREGDKKK